MGNTQSQEKEVALQRLTSKDAEAIKDKTRKFHSHGCCTYHTETLCCTIYSRPNHAHQYNNELFTGVLNTVYRNIQ